MRWPSFFFSDELPQVISYINDEFSSRQHTHTNSHTGREDEAREERTKKLHDAWTRREVKSHQRFNGIAEASRKNHIGTTDCDIFDVDAEA